MRPARNLALRLVALLAVLLFTHAALALDPAKSLSQYVHDRWDNGNGFLGGSVSAISQSQDGYLWIGTERGLVRFDGFNFTLIQYPLSPGAPVGAVRGLVSDAEGTLWIRLDGPHLLLYRNGIFEDAMARFALQEIVFTAMSLDQQGKLLLWGPQTRLLRFSEGRFQHAEVNPDIPGIVVSTASTPDNKLWLGAREIGLFQLNHGVSTNILERTALASLNALLPASGDRLWIGTDAGLKFWDGHALSNAGLPPALQQLQVLALLKDKNGNVWIGTSHGIIRITPGLEVAMDLTSNRPGSEVTTIYEDRDGDIWYGGSQGMERLRDGMFTAYSIGEGLPPGSNGPIYADDAGRTWFAPASGGLYWLKGTAIGHVDLAGLNQDVVYSISGGGGELWLGRQHGGLTVLTAKDASFAARTYTRADGLPQNSIYSVHRNRDGSVWTASVSAGVSQLRNGVFTNYSVANGLTSNAFFSIVEGYDGTMWFASPAGVEAYAQGTWKSYTAPTSLPSSTVRSIFEDSKHVLWIATSGGIAYLDANHIEPAAHRSDSLQEEVFGITEDKLASLWIVTSDHILQVSRDRLLSGSLNALDVQSYGIQDGLPGVEGVRRDRSVIADSSGRIWISLAHGLAMADPQQAVAQAAPVKVQIESVSTGAGQVTLTASPAFAAGTSSLTFHYTDSNLAVPQRVRFRYKLEGSEADWSDEVALREVTYKNLEPRSYRFRIVASNGAGVWNGPETAFSFSVAPQLWQTWWFHLFGLAACVLVVLSIIRLRTLQLTHRLNVRFQDRLAERTRIAQDLHDTLLQGVLSASLQLDLVEERTSDDSPTKLMLQRVLQLMGQVTEEGRSALRGLRIPSSDSLTLENALSLIQEEFASNPGTIYRVIAQGVARPLRQPVRDEAYRIAREAVINAFLHAKSANVEVEVEYATRSLRVIVRDDGCGMDPALLDTGREGHWGLIGMRERAETIGASLRLSSRVGAGTQVALVIPGAIAFENSSRPLARWRSWLTRENFDQHARTIRKREPK